MPRPFYIIAHNPNTVEDAINALKDGANALEPDVRFFSDKQFYVDEEIERFYEPDGVPLLIDYLNGLYDQLMKPENSGLNLALVLFDIKDLNYDINDLYEIIRNSALFEIFPEIPFVTTYGGENGFKLFNHLNQQNITEAVGIDQGTDPAKIKNYFNQNTIIKSYTFADGDSIFSSIGKLDVVKSAIKMRDDGGSFKLVYAWCVNSEYVMKQFLNINVDGLITDYVKRLYNLINSPAYNNLFTLATKNNNPFV